MRDIVTTIKKITGLYRVKTLNPEQIFYDISLCCKSKIKNKTKEKKKKKHNIFLFQIYSLTILASSKFGLKETLFESQMTKSRIPNTWLIQCGS